MAHRVTCERIAREAIAAVEGGRLVRAALAFRAPGLRVVWAVGKAALAMARGAADALGDDLAGGLIVDKVAGDPPPGLRALVGSHPWPDARSVAAADALFAEARARRPGDRVLLLLSGGASALIGAPVDGVTLDELVSRTRTLVESGASIHEINAVRRKLARLAGGRLAAATAAAIDVLALSDVIGDDPAIIGSGPTTPDEGAPPFPHVTFRVLANPITLRDATARAATAAGLGVRVREALVVGPVERFAEELAAEARALQPGEAFVAAGEPTVRVGAHGVGGRAQHLALLMAIELEGSACGFVACGSDGSDGPTDSAGAAVDGDTTARARAHGLDPASALLRFDSHPLLSAIGATIDTGPTGTNLTDLFLLYRAA